MFIAPDRISYRELPVNIQFDIFPLFLQVALVMNSNRLTFKLGVALCLLIVAAFAVFHTPNTDAAPYVPNLGPVATPDNPTPHPVYKAAITNNNVLTLTNGTYTFTNPTNVPARLSNTNQLGLMVAIAAAGASTSNVIFNVEVSPDGTNWLSFATNQFIVPLNGTTLVVHETNFPISVTYNMHSARLKTIGSPAITSYYVSNAVWIRRTGVQFQPN